MKKTVYYLGSKDEWNNVEILYGDDDHTLLTPNLFFFSETAPSETGKYWHYVDDKPTKW